MKKNILPLPEHQDCEILTGLMIDSILPRGDGLFATARGYQKGGNVWRPDDRSDGIFFLESGEINILVSDREGREVVLGIIQAGEPFGELCFCAPKKKIKSGNLCPRRRR